MGASHRYFTPLANILAKKYRVRVPDLPGHGTKLDDDRPVTVARFAHKDALALRELKVAHAIVLGHPLGAQVSTELARTWLALVKHLPIAALAVNDREATLFRQARRLLRAFPTS
ncbi:alpha/beta fold hydrolase [Glutamicibacter sp. JL.03c]|uniref:alpha/beta fold hydrolase n=1 Tax=Glutamicibacter sp. JL.03c TaxID=2984842 RepID=UPI0039AF3B15